MLFNILLLCNCMNNLQFDNPDIHFVSELFTLLIVKYFCFENIFSVETFMYDICN